MSVAQRAKAVYAEDYRENLEANRFGDFVAIEPESRDSFVAATFIEAALAAKQSYPSRMSFVIRIGYEAAVHIGAATTALFSPYSSATAALSRQKHDRSIATSAREQAA